MNQDSLGGEWVVGFNLEKLQPFGQVLMRFGIQLTSNLNTQETWD